MHIDRRDLLFQLFEVLDIEALCANPRYADYDRTAFEGIIDTASQIAIHKFEPHAALLDEEEPKFVDGRVEIRPEVREALDAYVEAGFMGGGFDYELGGMQLPETIRQIANFLFTMANVGTAGYPFLTMAAANMLNAFGDETQREHFVKPMVEGRYFGTMCLSEPQAGSSLSDITTKAEPQEDGSYRISGRKMWISGGEHELSENIVHMVLAKIPGGPPGVKGISLFAVPRICLNADGSLGDRNDVALAGLNHKMGYRGTVNTLLNFGENGNCVGYLVGRPHKGLSYMFHMMNEARIGVGLGATALAAAGYQVSLDYAKTRPQGRHPDGKDPTAPQVMLIEHADIRRLLLAQKTAQEGALALCLYCAVLVDRERITEDAAERENARLLLEILTPIAKSWPSEFCLEANKHAIQVLGGYGYTRDYPLERLYRDNRLNPIHEGTHGIQGMDLLGRKVGMENGAATKLLFATMRITAREAADTKSLAGHADALLEALVEAEETTAALLSAMAGGEVRRALANATIYLDMLGHVVVAWTWLRQAIVAAKALETAQDGERAFYEGKLQACRYFYAYELPRTGPQRALLKSLDDTCLAMPADAF